MLQYLVSLIDNFHTLQVVMLVIGIIFLIVEIFIPSFGILGILGIALLIISIFLTASSFAEGIIMFLILLFVVGALIFILFRLASKGKIGGRLLNTDTLSSEKGYLATEDMQSYIGAIGVAQTALRPVGVASFEHKELDVITKGEFIAKDTQIIVESVEGARVVVREYKGG